MRGPVRGEADGGGRPAASAMKEDKENARPKEKRGGPLTPTGLGAAVAGADAKGGGEPDKLERPKEKKETLSKVRSCLPALPCLRFQALPPSGGGAFLWTLPAQAALSLHSFHACRKLACQGGRISLARGFSL